MVWRYASRNLGAVAGAAALTLVLWNAAGVTNVMFPFLMNFSIPVAALAAAWWHLDRTSLRGEVAASVWLGVALATSGAGNAALQMIDSTIVRAHQHSAGAKGGVIRTLWDPRAAACRPRSMS